MKSVLIEPAEKQIGLEALAQVLDEFEAGLADRSIAEGVLSRRFADVVNALGEGERLSFLVALGWWMAESLKGFTVSSGSVRTAAAHFARQ